MNRVLFDALILLAVCTVLHTAGLVLISKLPLRWHRQALATFSGRMWNLIAIAWCLIILHVIEIALWAMAFYWQGCFPNLETSFYFSGVTYSTIGYGDVVLPHSWRLLGPLEGLTGILMCGLSTAFYFAAVLRIFSPAPSEDSSEP